MVEKMAESLRRRTIKSFMDILILEELRKGKALSGYDIISYIHNRFDLLVSSGTIYSLLYSLERDGLIEGMSAGNNRKRVYSLTKTGKENDETLSNAHEEIQKFLRNIHSLP